MKSILRLLAVLLAVVLVAAACSDDTSDADPGDPPVDDNGSTDDPPADDPPADDPPADDPPADDPPADDPPADDPPADDPPADDPPDEPAALDDSGDQVMVDWGAVTPVFTPDAGGDDHFFHVHSSNAVHDFYLSFEFYTVWGGAWTGGTGTFPIGCNDPTNDTGICVNYVTANGDNLGADFGASGTVTINQLDADGYEILVGGLTFTDGTTFADFTMVG
ncbi:MAG: hypothetical protein P8J50_08995 [Acidimicrobiales bacterium]|nr:hypothetical protein [Acidimicrobiales bacterium]